MEGMWMTAPGEIQEYMIEQGLSVASNSFPQTVCCMAPFFFYSTQKIKPLSLHASRQETLEDNWYYHQKEGIS